MTVSAEHRLFLIDLLKHKAEQVEKRFAETEKALCDQCDKLYEVGMRMALELASVREEYANFALGVAVIVEALEAQDGQQQPISTGRTSGDRPSN